MNDPVIKEIKRLSWNVTNISAVQELALIFDFCAGVMHGGAYGILFDMFTMTAIGPLARKGYWE